MSRWHGFALCLVLLVVTTVAVADPPSPGAPGELRGRVVAVADGDTLTLLVGTTQHRIRLAQIDAPESGQPFGRASKRELSRLAFGRDVRVEVVDRDRYGRLVGEVFVDGTHVNQEMVRTGHAWAYTEYARSTEIVALEGEARAAGRGLWALPEAERDPPWVWRAQKRARSERPAPPPGPPRPCGQVRTCGEMRSCEEARFHLETCGLRRLDGDGDGIPCEKLCGGRSRER